jgi:hypothetical protein
MHEGSAARTCSISPIVNWILSTTFPAGPSTERSNVGPWSIGTAAGRIGDVLNYPEPLGSIVGISEHAEDCIVELRDELSEVSPRVGLDFRLGIVVSGPDRLREIASRAVY